MSTTREEREGLTARLAAAFADDLPAERFEGLALELFDFQYRHVEPYRRLCDARGATPGRVAGADAIPAVPTSLFRRQMFFTGAPGQEATVFSTSGTTGSVRGRSFFSGTGLALMRESMVRNARRMLFPEGRRLLMLVLAPPPAAAPHMIMAWGMTRLIEDFGTPDSAFLIGPDGPDVPGLLRHLEAACAAGTPVALLGASFAFVNLLEAFRGRGVAFRLPEGSRVMDAGGYKGRSRELSRRELTDLLADRLGVPASRAVNLLGMTELASQIYDDTLAATCAGRPATGLKTPPPWVRSAVVDPLTGAPQPAGRPGVLRHLDLANLDTPLAVLTDDVAQEGPGGGFELRGRLSADASRGCSLTLDELTGRAT